MISISVCIITKNEENNIADCINSVINIADEIIVLDTGSTDKTIDIASSFPKTKVYQTNWENDNSKARNECISYAIYDWILVIDADEVLSEYTQENLKEIIDFNYSNSLYEVFNFQIYEGNRNYYKRALFPNNSGIYFEGIVHEYLTKKDVKLISDNCEELSIIHKPRKNKSEYYISLINKQLKISDKEQTGIYLKHLGDEYYNLKDYNISLQHYLKARIILKYYLEKDNLFYLELLRRSSFICSSILNKYQTAIELSKEYLGIKSSYYIFYYLMNSYFLDGQYNQVIKLYKDNFSYYAENAKPDFLFEINFIISKSYLSLNNHPKFIKHLDRCKKISPNRPELIRIIDLYNNKGIKRR